MKRTSLRKRIRRFSLSWFSILNQQAWFSHKQWRPSLMAVKSSKKVYLHLSQNSRESKSTRTTTGSLHQFTNLPTDKKLLKWTTHNKWWLVQLAESLLQIRKSWLRTKKLKMLTRKSWQQTKECMTADNQSWQLTNEFRTVAKTS